MEATWQHDPGRIVGLVGPQRGREVDRPEDRPGHPRGGRREASSRGRDDVRVARPGRRAGGRRAASRVRRPRPGAAPRARTLDAAPRGGDLGPRRGGGRGRAPGPPARARRAARALRARRRLRGRLAHRPRAGRRRPSARVVGPSRRRALGRAEAPRADRAPAPHGRVRPPPRRAHEPPRRLGHGVPRGLARRAEDLRRAFGARRLARPALPERRRGPHRRGRERAARGLPGRLRDVPQAQGRARPRAREGGREAAADDRADRGVHPPQHRGPEDEAGPGAPQDARADRAARGAARGRERRLDPVRGGARLGRARPRGEEGRPRLPRDGPAHAARLVPPAPRRPHGALGAERLRQDDAPEEPRARPAAALGVGRVRASAS